MRISRRKFIKQISIVSLGFASFTRLAASQFISSHKSIDLTLEKDSNGIINLPKNFEYKIISKHKDLMIVRTHTGELHGLKVGSMSKF